MCLSSYLAPQTPGYSQAHGNWNESDFRTQPVSESTWLLFPPSLCLPGRERHRQRLWLDPFALPTFGAPPLGRMSRGLAGNGLSLSAEARETTVAPGPASCASAILTVLSSSCFLFSFLSSLPKCKGDTGDLLGFGSNRTRHTTHIILFLAST